MRVVSNLILLSTFLAVNISRAEPVELLPQRITLPAGAGKPLFVDIDGSGRCSLLVIDPVQHTLLNYPQHPDGFSRTPEQVIPLPAQTAWVAVDDIDAHLGLELLMSTATGLVYSRQNDSRFETERRPLIEVKQVFTNCDLPPLTLLATNLSGPNGVIPVISAGQVVWYHRDSAYEWSPGSPLALITNQTSWSSNPDQWFDSWALGPSPAHRLGIQQSWQAESGAPRDEDSDNETIRKIVADMKKAPKTSPPKVEHVDIDGDGREDVFVWQVSGFMDYKTDLYLFLRKADQSLPEQPTCVLHCRGLPLPSGPGYRWSPMQDLHGDGIYELVLLEFKTRIMSGSGLLETVMSHGLDWALTIRSFHHDGFAHSPDASIPVTAFLPGEVLGGWPFFFQGDFNGDGRPDLLIRRSDTQWNIFLSTTDGHWFTPQPAMTFEVPAQGYIEIKDLNGDGLSDVIWHELNQPNLYIFLSPPRPAKDKNP